MGAPPHLCAGSHAHFADEKPKPQGAPSPVPGSTASEWQHAVSALKSPQTQGERSGAWWAPGPPGLREDPPPLPQRGQRPLLAVMAGEGAGRSASPPEWVKAHNTSLVGGACSHHPSALGRSMPLAQLHMEQRTLEARAAWAGTPNTPGAKAAHHCLSHRARLRKASQPLAQESGWFKQEALGPTRP